MGKKAKTSRKGKKAWRANISTEDIEDYFEKSTKDALSGGSLTDLPSDSLFYVDKSSDLSVKRKIEKHREKVLHCDSLLQMNSFVQPIPSSTQIKSKKKRKEVRIVKDQVCPKDDGVSESGMVDLWDDKGVFLVTYIARSSLCFMRWHIAENLKLSLLLLQVSKTSVIPAVEVEPPGCSFNPSFDSHQDSLARAVADEMQKIYRKELGPQPVPLTVHGEVINEEDMYFLDAEDGSDDDDSNENLGGDGDMELEKGPPKTKRVTRVEQNKRARNKKKRKLEAEAKKAEGLSKEIDSLPDIIQEIEKEDEEKHKRHLRRVVAKEERQKSRPPRFGRHKFEPAPLQVLLSEEISGSIRKLKGCCTLARDRFKSFEKRGLVVPTAKSGSDFRAAWQRPSVHKNLLSHEQAIEEEAERKIGWLLKLIFAGTAAFVGYQFFPYLGENLMQQSVSLLHVKDPLFKRMGASRLARFAIDDERRMKIVQIGGALELVNMLGTAKDDRTRKESLKALVALSHSVPFSNSADEAVGALHNAGAISIIRSTPDSVEDAELVKHKLDLLKRFEDLKFDAST
ncbi:hypothetical protein RJ639_018073 [Escallonia herrerae]|uniref:Ribosome biogenesis protein NOP53 n=1 Tax=Escallonia herrerae TaxID=1293975 RepID=A0AA88V797_9ASTE|nr:hypothetical protein RJ639_018073 [Escallonia herrerae]